ALVLLPVITFTSFPWLPNVFLLILQLLSIFSNTSASNDTSGDTPSNSTSTSEIPPCFKGLEEEWAELNKDGQEEYITPLEHLANYLRKTRLQVDYFGDIDDEEEPCMSNDEEESCMSNDEEES
ncbi:11122_t:CDS:2, partial [Paraglomus occultum]